MRRHERIAPNLMSAHLVDGEIDLNRSHGCSCFFIVNESNDKVFIDKTAMEFILSGCKDFHFFGEMEPVWHVAFDLMDSTIFPNASYENVALTSGYADIEEFVDVLHEAISLRSFVPHDCYLLYDDEAMYRQVVAMLTKQGC